MIINDQVTQREIEEEKRNNRLNKCNTLVWNLKSWMEHL